MDSQKLSSASEQQAITSFFKTTNKPKLTFQFNNGPIIQPNDEQKKIIFENKLSHMSIKACAGSGKTTTILCRVKYLIEIENVHPSKILMTAFNVDAAKNIKQKLNDLLTDKVGSQITVNNVDKLSKMWISQVKQFDVKQLSVREYTAKLVQLMNQHQEFKDKIVKQFDYIFFDEFQDINPDEYELLKIFAKEKTSITVVGDDAQNIYGFRESKVNTSAYIHTDFVNIKQFYLTTNYRSTDPIVQFANQVIACSKKDYGYKMQMTSYPPNNVDHKEKPDFSKYMSTNEQSQAIITHIAELIEMGYPCDQIAVLSRTNKPLQFLEEALEMYNSQIKKQSQLQQDPILINSQDDRFKKPTLFENINNSVLIPYVAHITDAQEKSNPIKIKQQQNKKKEPKVTLTTIHKSKGLEWDVVFLMGLNDNFFPGTNKVDDVEEERRVFYVAITRAKRKLLMSFIWSKTNQNMSRFVSEVSTNYYTGYTQPLISEQYKCTEKSRAIEKIKSRTVILSDIIDFLTKEHYEQLRSQGCLDLKRDTMQIHFKCGVGKYVVENNLVQEFSTFFKCYLLRSLGEEYISGGNSEFFKEDESKQVKLCRYEDDAMKMAYNNKYALGVLVSEAALANAEHNEVNQLVYQIDKDVLNNTYIPEENKRQLLFLSFVYFQERKCQTDNILKHVFYVAMCQSLYYQRRRLLHKDDAFKHFELNKNILKTARKSFLPEVLKNSPKKAYINQTLYDESTQMKAEYDIITEDTIYEIRFQQICLYKPEDSIELLAKAAILQNAWKNTKIKYLCIYYPLQGELTTIDISEKATSLNMVLKVLYQARQEKQDACSQAPSQSTPSSTHESQMNLSQPIKSLFHATDNPMQHNFKDTKTKQLFQPGASQQFNTLNNIKNSQNIKQKLSLFEQYGDENGLYENSVFQGSYPQDITKQSMTEFKKQLYNKVGNTNIKQDTFYSSATINHSEFLDYEDNNEFFEQNKSVEEILSQGTSKNFGFVKASDIASIKTNLSGQQSLSAQQKLFQSATIQTGVSSNQYQKPQENKNFYSSSKCLKFKNKSNKPLTQEQIQKYSKANLIKCQKDFSTKYKMVSDLLKDDKKYQKFIEDA